MVPIWVASAHARARSKNYAYQNWKAGFGKVLVARHDAQIERPGTSLRKNETSSDARPNRNSRDCSYAVTQLVS